MIELPREDSLLERKVESDLKDLLKTLVAFANSVRPDHVATILIDSSVQDVTNPDAIRKTVREKYEQIYPAIIWRSTVCEKDGKILRPSGNRIQRRNTPTLAGRHG